MEHSLRLITYLVPSHPVELYECIARFLEEELNIRAVLLYESRDPIELFEGCRDPFILDEADIGFFNPMQYVKMKKMPVRQFELLPVTPVFVHPKNTTYEPGYYSDIIMHVDIGKTVRSFLDLRGSSWGYTGDNSLSSCVTIKKLLRTHGEDPTFFGNTIKTGNHLLSVKKVQDKQVAAAAVDSTAFYNYRNVLHKDSDDVCVLHSVGPLPPYAIVCNKSLDAELKSRIVRALTDGLPEKRQWIAAFRKYGLVKFAGNADDAYVDLELNEILDGDGLSSVYYY